MINLNHLPNQQRDESCQIFLRRHWIVLIGIFAYAFGLLMIPTLVIVFVKIGNFGALDALLANQLAVVFLSTYVLIIVLITMTQFTDYYLDMWIVTNERVINTEQHGLFSRTISELHLNQIQDVTSEMHGMIATFLTYGDVIIQTAGTKERFHFEQIDNPDQVKEHILTLVDDDKRRHGDASGVGGGTALADEHKTMSH
jgi:hypothetical protein